MNMLRNERKKGKKYRERFGYMTPKESWEALLLDNNNGNTVWYDAIYKEMTALDDLHMFQFYPPNKRV